MLSRTLSRQAGSAIADSRRVPLRLRSLPMRALSESHCLASLGSFTTVAVAVISALALAVSQGGG